jgi:hypothetical protein
VTAAGKVADADPGGESVMGSRTLFFSLGPCRQQAAAAKCKQPQHSVTRWRAGIRSRAADFTMLELEQCATLHLPVLDFHMIALGGSTGCYSGASGCGGNGAIFFTCMTGRHDRRAISSHLCCGRCAIRSGWTVGRRAGRIVCWPSCSRWLRVERAFMGRGLAPPAGPAAAIYRD